MVPSQDPGDMWAFADLGGLQRLLEKASAEGQFVPDRNLPMTLEPSKALALEWAAAYRVRAEETPR